VNSDIFISTVLIIVALGAIVVAANIADKRRDPRLRQWVMGVLLVTNLMLVVWYGILPLGIESNEDEGAALVASFALAVVLGVASTAVLFQPVREWLARFLPARQEADPALAGRPQVGMLTTVQDGPPGEPLFPQMLGYYTTTTRLNPQPVAPAASPVIRGFDSRSTVHTVALAFCIYLLGTQFLAFLLGGGLEGVAEGFSDGLTAWDLLLNGLPLLVIPVLGVGWGIRRDFRQTLDRLGLGPLTVQGVGVAVGMAIGLLILVSIVGVTWQFLTPPETFEEQTQASDALAESVDTVWLALVLAGSAAISEEIACRGALQPVFGFWATALIFALTHMQYAFTPAALIILGVALAFGWIRLRFNTTVAIATHFLYNFIPLALNIAIGEEALLWLRSLGLPL
jgi:membrane protease YdiL (CAAX protease family)